MLKYGDPNPLNIHGKRMVEDLPPHFEVVSFELHTSLKQIINWIYENLEGRFWAGEFYCIETQQDGRPRITQSKAVAFEISGEASMFSLMLDSINKTKF